MKLLSTMVILVFAIQFKVNAQNGWESNRFLGKVNIQFFAREIANIIQPDYDPENKSSHTYIYDTKINIIGDTLAMYLYKNSTGIDFGADLNTTRLSTISFTDSLEIQFKNNSLPKNRPGSNLHLFNKANISQPQKISILINSNFLIKNLNTDSILSLPEGTKFNGMEVIKKDNIKMLFIKFPTKYQDEICIQMVDIKTDLKFYKYSFSHIDAFPKLINYYNLNQKNIFEVINNRDSIQLTINDSSFGDYKPGRLTTNGSGMQLTMQKYSNGDNVRILFKNKAVQIINLKPEENNILLLFQRFNDTDTLKLLYQFIDEEKSDTTWHTASDVFILQFTNLLPGKRYGLKTKYNLTPYAVSYYVFTVDIKWWQTTWAKFLAAFLAGAVLIGFGWVIYRNRQQRRLKKARSEKAQLNFQLDSVRSQLNPHFIFNALASVQSLINKNDVHNANVYLSQISTLMRETLEYSKQAMISLEDEIKMITNYINIEQLRSHFTYIITIDPDIQQSQVDVPAMLLQPIVENSIKHALSSTPDGKLSIKIFTTQKEMHIQIEDNGKGFDVNTLSKKGYGLRLTEERIGLFNKLYQQCSIDYIFTSEINKGTTTNFIFNNWINI